MKRTRSGRTAERANRRIARYHVLSIIPYATAATAGVAWGWLRLGADDTDSASVHWRPVLAAGERWVGVQGEF